MKRFKVSFFLLLLSLLVSGQNNFWEGTNHYSSYLNSASSYENGLLLYSSFNTCVQIKLSFRSKSTYYQLHANKFVKIDLDSLASFLAPDSVEFDTIFNRAIMIESNLPLLAFQFDKISTQLGVSRHSLLAGANHNSKYFILHGRFNDNGMQGMPILSLLSSSGLNTVFIKPKFHSIYYRPNGASLMANLSGTLIYLDSLETILSYVSYESDQLYGYNSTFIEATGSLVSTIIDGGNGDGPWFNKSSCSPSGIVFNASPITYQNKPLYMAGTYYPFTPVNKQGKDYVHLLATRPNTSLYYNGQFVKTLDSLELWDTCFTQAGIIGANMPLMFGQFVQRNAVNAQPYEVFSIGVQTSDTSEYIKKTIFDATPNTAHDSTVFPVNLTAYTADTALLLHNGLPLQNLGWQPFSGNANLSWCTFFVQPGVHILESSSKFSALYYPHSFFNPPSYLLKAQSSYMLPGLTPTQEAADSIQFYYQSTTGQKEPWANGTVAACSGMALTLYPNIAHHTTWQWAFGDGSTQTQRISSQRAKPISHTWQSPGQYWVTITDSAGCTQGDSLLVIVKDVPQAAFSYTANAGCSGTLVQLQNQSVGATSYTWQWPGGSSTAQNPSFVYSGPDTTLTVTLIATDGTCSGTTAQTFSINNSAFNIKYVPNVITPNNDGVNDAFCISGTSGFTECFQLEIFNRWGTRVFATQNPQECWEPSNIAAGVYFYVLTLGQQRVQGEVTVF
jgi:gliding motility-associated-like protein